MAVIKCADAGSATRDAVVLDLGDLQREADRLRAQAEAEARDIRARASREADRIIEEAMQRGFDEGQKAGAEQGRAAGFEAGRNEAYEATASELSGLIARWSAALEAFETARDRLVREARQDVLELAIRLGERVSRAAIKADPGAAERQLLAALDLVLDPTRLRVEVHPRDQERLAHAIPSILAAIGRSAHADVVESPDIEPGGVRVRTESGVIDARVGEQLRRLADALRPAGPSPRWPEGADGAAQSGAEQEETPGDGPAQEEAS